MTMTDAQIAREWAEGFIKHADSAQIVDADELTAARHILATTTPPTMADIAWDDAVHAGLCAEHETLGMVRVLGKLPSGDIVITTTTGKTWCSAPGRLTPIPGTKIDLTPRRTHADTVTAASIEDHKSGRVVDFDDKTLLPRPEDVPDDSPLIPEDDWRYASDATVALWHRLVPESTPDHPTVLTTEADYRGAPAGTVVATEGEGAWTWTKGRDGFWEAYGVIDGCSNYAVSGEARQVLRWGWEA